MLRFLAVGASNTGVTFVAFVLLATILDPRVAYTVVFSLGLVFSVLMARRVVFQIHVGRTRLLLLGGWYLVVYGVGILILGLLHGAGITRPIFTGVALLCVTSPLNYAGGRFLFITHGPTRA